MLGGAVRLHLAQLYRERSRYDLQRASISAPEPFDCNTYGDFR